MYLHQGKDTVCGFPFAHTPVHRRAQLLWVLFNVKYDVQEDRLERVCTCPGIRAGGGEADV